MPKSQNFLLKENRSKGYSSKHSFARQARVVKNPEEGSPGMKKSLDEIRDILSRHRDELREKYKITEIGIFGSYMRGEQRKRSDIDILVEIGEPVSLLRFVGIENYLSDLLKTKVDLIPKESIRPELKERILKEVVFL